MAGVVTTASDGAGHTLTRPRHAEIGEDLVSRSMERVWLNALASGGARNVLTVPADHKYEVLQVQLFVTNPGATETLAYVLDTTANLRLYEWHKPPAFARQDRFTWPGLVLYATEHLQMWVVSAAPQTFEATVVYVDVDYTT